MARCFGSKRAFLQRLSSLIEAREALRKYPSLYGEIVTSGVSTIVTTSICSTFPKAVGATQRGTHPIGDEENDRRSDFRFQANSGPVDGWQLNGSVTTPEKIRLGSLEHPDTIADLERQRRSMMKLWPRGADDRAAPPREYDRMFGPLGLTWFENFMIRPLVFVGMQMDPSEWPLWWLLHQRRRLASVFPPADRPSTLVLGSVENPQPQLRNGPAGLEMIEFPTFDAMWETLREELRKERANVSRPSTRSLSSSAQPTG
jgi:hypothetical protein